MQSVEDCISSKEQEMAKLREEQPPGWQEERSFLLADKQALVEEKRQLREELRQLREVLLTLMKREDRE